MLLLRAMNRYDPLDRLPLLDDNAASFNPSQTGQAAPSAQPHEGWFETMRAPRRPSFVVHVEARSGGAWHAPLKADDYLAWDFTGLYARIRETVKGKNDRRIQLRPPVL